MPQLSPAAALQIALLLSAVPAQYYLCRWSGSTAARRYHATSRLLRIWKEWRSSYLNGSAWMDWTSEQMSRFRSLVGLEQEDQESAASPPMESMLIDNDQGFFGASKAVRSPRPPYVFLRVGEVVMERKGHMVGVVVSWDPELRAPPEWTDRMFSDSQGMTVEKTPHYKVLFGGPGPSSLMVAYLPQTQLERVTGMKVSARTRTMWRLALESPPMLTAGRFQPDIPTLENYFTHYDGTRFVMQPWLRALFPEDESED
ncbi:uncharacterized protein si:dkey-261l7.2 isoform X1 [Oryzias latipes]